MPTYDQEMDFEDEGDLRAYGARRWLRAPCLKSPTALKRTLLGGAVVIALLVVGLLAHLLFSSSRLPSFEVLRSPSDRREAEYIILKNGLRVLLVSDPKGDKAGAAMDVAAGALDDPDDHEGLAHFLEHMLFLGSAKYPQEGEFSKYVQLHAGSTNAYTDQGHTNFHFSVQTDSLEGALDRWAQFFIAPLLQASGAMREMNAVNAEHKKNLQNDEWRLWQLTKHLASPLHPFHKFSTGSLETLDQEDTVDQLVRFYERYYTSASTMRLAIVGQEGLEQLEQWAVKYFSAIPQKSPAQRRHPTEPVWPQTGLRVDVAPIADLRQVTAMWALPPLQTRYRNMVPRFLQYVLAGEAEGSLYQVLKAKDYGRAVELSLEDVRDFTLLELKVALTRAGVQHWQEVVTAVFQSLALLQRTPLLCPLWEDRLALARLRFRFQEATDPIMFVATAAVAMQYQNPADLLGSPQNFVCDESLLRYVVDALVPDQMMLFVVSPDHTNLTDIEPIYGTHYAVSPLPAATLAAWMAAVPPAEMALPSTNQFLPTTFDVFFQPEPRNRIRKVHEVTGLRVWHQPSQLFSQPRLIYKCEVHYPAYRFDPAKLVLLHLYAEMLNDLLEPPLYEAEQVGVEGSVKDTAASLVFTVSGLTEPSAKLWPILLLAWRQRLSEERFRAIKERTVIDVSNLKFASPFIYALRVLRPLLLERPTMTPSQQLSLLDGIDFGRLQRFAEAIRREPNHVECLAFGNVLEKDAVVMAATLATTVQITPTDELRVKEVVEWLPGVEAAIQSPCPNPMDLNSVLLTTFQYPTGPALAPALRLELVQFILKEDVFQRLRTEEQLGYAVFTLVAATETAAYNMSYYYVLIQSADWPPDYLDDRVEAFIDSALQELLPRISPQDLQDLQLALWQQKWPIPLNLAEEADVVWSEIADHTYVFDRKEQERQALQGISLDDLQQTFSAVVAEPAARRKVSLLLYGKGRAMGTPQGTQPFKEVLNITDLAAWAERQRWLPAPPPPK